MSEKILLIEDDLTMQTLLKTYLQLEGFQVALQKNDDYIEELLDTIRLERPAVVLLDVYLRRVNGLDLLAAIRADNELKDTRVIVSSGADFGERCRTAGADAFILKPYMPDELILSINNLIALKRDLERE